MLSALPEQRVTRHHCNRQVALSGKSLHKTCTHSHRRAKVVLRRHGHAWSTKGSPVISRRGWAVIGTGGWWWVWVLWRWVLLWNKRTMLLRRRMVLLLWRGWTLWGLCDWWAPWSAMQEVLSSLQIYHFHHNLRQKQLSYCNLLSM